MQRNTGNTESITVEYGFLDSNKDDVYQLKNNWQTYADAVVQGVLNYINSSPLDSSYYIVKRGDSNEKNVEECKNNSVCDNDGGSNIVSRQ